MDATLANQQLFSDTLCCEMTLPVSLEPDTGELADWRAMMATRLLQTVAIIENSHREERVNDDNGPHPADWQRMEAKLDLLLALVSKREPQPLPLASPVALCWSERGLRLMMSATDFAVPGVHALLRLPVTPWLGTSLDLPVRVLASGEHDAHPALWLSVNPLTDDLAEAMRRHLFRLHRRAIADERRTL